MRQWTHRYPPGALRYADAAAYCQISESLFSQLVRDGLMPRPAKVGGCSLYLTHELDEALNRLKHGDDADGADPWGKAA
jgi:predicted DNA-binding transcriptional regulator AlpA